MRKKKFISFFLSTTMLVSMALGGCAFGATDEAELLTAEQRAELGEGGVAEGEGATAEGEEGATSGGFEDGATIGIAIPWFGTQNWVEASDMFTEQLEAEGFKVDIQQADQDVETQKSQIASMVDNGAKVIVVASVDGTQLSEPLQKAKSAGVYVIGYDRLIENTADVDGVVQFGSVKTGELQAQALLEGLEKKKGPGPYNIELFGGGPLDPNAGNFFAGALPILQPLIDDGTITVVSGEMDFDTCATKDWNNDVASERMNRILDSNYTDKKIDGILAPNDGIARATITACIEHGQEIPVTSGLDAEFETIEWIWAEKQYSTVAKPTSSLVSKTVEIIKSLKAGQGMPSTSVSANNGVIDVAVYELPPVVVTKDNAKEAFMNDPDRLALLK